LLAGVDILLGDIEAYFAAIGKKSGFSTGDPGVEFSEGDSVRARVALGSKRFREGDVAEGGRRRRQNVSLSLISSWTYLSKR
jgi:hypothetical protein